MESIRRHDSQISDQLKWSRIHFNQSKQLRDEIPNTFSSLHYVHVCLWGLLHVCFGASAVQLCKSLLMFDGFGWEFSWYRRHVSLGPAQLLRCIRCFQLSYRQSFVKVRGGKRGRCWWWSLALHHYGLAQNESTDRSSGEGVQPWNIQFKKIIQILQILASIEDIFIFGGQ